MKQLTYFTVKETAGICGVVPLTVLRWIYSGKLPAKQFKAKTKYYILETDIPTFLRREFHDK
jgi:hypothetical protein